MKPKHGMNFAQRHYEPDKAATKLQKVTTDETDNFDRTLVEKISRQELQRLLSRRC